jgi:hypothetical protein
VCRSVSACVFYVGVERKNRISMCQHSNPTHSPTAVTPTHLFSYVLVSCCQTAEAFHGLVLYERGGALEGCGEHCEDF